MSGRPQGPAIRRDCHCPKTRHEHGTPQAYRWDRCRCADCRKSIAAEKSAYTRAVLYGRWDGSLVPVEGTTRRLRALAVKGWSMPRVAARSGVHVSQLHSYVEGRCGPMVLPRTAALIARVYDELWDMPPDGTANSISKIRRWAERNGWVGPLCWDDDDIDDPDAVPYRERYVHAANRGLDQIAIAEAIRGRRVRLTPAERAEAVLLMTAQGLSASVIADRLGATTRAVIRRRSRGIRGAA